MSFQEESCKERNHLIIDKAVCKYDREKSILFVSFEYIELNILVLNEI